MQHVQALRQKKKEDKKSGGNNWDSLRSPSRCCLMYRSARTGKKRRKLQGERRRRQAWPRHASKSTSVRRRRGPSCQGSKNRRGVKLCNGNDARRRKSPGRRGRTKRPGRRQSLARRAVQQEKEGEQAQSFRSCTATCAMGSWQASQKLRGKRTAYKENAANSRARKTGRPLSVQHETHLGLDR